jgi:hypothetical protein
MDYIIDYIELESAKKAAIMTTIAAMEPLLPEDHKGELANLATDLIAKTSALGGKLHSGLQDGIGTLVRSMNCYYSNLIEGHHTHPIDIDRALAGDYSARGKAPELTGYQERQARTVLNKLIDLGLLVSPTTRSDVRLGLPISVVDRWFPRLYSGPASVPD